MLNRRPTWQHRAAYGNIQHNPPKRQRQLGNPDICTGLEPIGDVLGHISPLVTLLGWRYTKKLTAIHLGSKRRNRTAMNCCGFGICRLHNQFFWPHLEELLLSSHSLEQNDSGLPKKIGPGCLPAASATKWSAGR